jgi:pyruvate formate lyase activating enzyme
LVGRRYDVTELVRVLLRDEKYYQCSGGGVTFSGGEPTLAADFLSPVLDGLRSHGVHVAIQTAGTFRWQEFADLLLPGIDLVYFDLKLFDPTAHRRHTGLANTGILENFVRLCEQTSVEVVPRIPLVPGITDTPENLAAIEVFLTGRRCHRLERLPYNPAGPAKRAHLRDTHARPGRCVSQP